MADIKKILTRVKDYVTQEDNLEKTRAENAEEALQDNIDAEEQARIDAINALDLTQVGSDGNYIKFVSQEDGQVAAQKQAFDTDMTNATNGNAPTTKNVKDYVDNTINNLDKAEVGEDGKYIKKIKEDNGIITATLKEFDTLIDNNADNTNTPTTKAVKDYTDTETARATAAEQIITTNLANEVQNRIADVDAEEARAKAAEQTLDTTIKALDFTQIGQDGCYLKTIKQVDGQITATVNTFDTNLQNADDTNAPTSLAVKDYVDDADTTLQHNIDTENSRALLAESNLTNNLATEVNDRTTADSALQSNITAEANTRAAADTALANRVTTLENSTAVADEQARAIAAETALGARINALDLPTTGSAGSYIKTVTQADGQLGATVQQFDIDLTSVTNNNAPTTKLVDDTYSKILEAVTNLSLSLDTTTYVLTVNLKNRAGTVVAHDTVDLPIESLVTTAGYDAANHLLYKTTAAGNTTTIVGLSTLVHDAGLDDAEHTANKATAWVGPSDVSYIDDSHYPTTKLMYDTLETMNNNIEELIESATNILTIDVANVDVVEGYITAEEYSKINERTIIKFNYAGAPSALASHLCFHYSFQMLGLAKVFSCVGDDDFILFAVNISPETSGTYAGLYHWGKETSVSDLTHAVKDNQDNEFDHSHKNTFKGKTEFQDIMTIKSEMDLTTDGYIKGGYISSSISAVSYRAATQLDDIADAIWNAKKAYAVGDIIFYSRALYRCEVAVSASSRGNTDPASDTVSWTKLFTNQS